MKFALKPQGLFVILASLFGFLLIFLTPPLQSPDENAHFYRAYSVANLDINMHSFEEDGQTRYGSKLPESVTDTLPLFLTPVAGKYKVEFNKQLYKQYFKQPLNPQNKKYIANEAGGMYSPIIYIPQAFGIIIGKIFEFSPLIIIWLGRLMNLLAWVTICYFAIKILPFAKWALVVLALNPVAVFLSASLSPDVLNISLAFLFVSLVFYLFTAKGKVATSSLVLLSLILAALALSKPVNLLFALLLFAIPWKRFGSVKKYLIYCISSIILAFSLFLAWNIHAKPMVEAAVRLQSPIGKVVSVTGQLNFVIDNPLKYIETIILNYIIVRPETYGDAVLTTYFGVFGWLDTSIPLWTIVVYIMLLFFALLYQFGRGVSLNKWQKITSILILVLSFVGGITAMYFNATPVGSNIISGVQGRYFIASSVLIIGLFTARKKILIISERLMYIIISATMLTILSMTIMRIYMRYY